MLPTPRTPAGRSPASFSTTGPPRYLMSGSVGVLTPEVVVSRTPDVFENTLDVVDESVPEVVEVTPGESAPAVGDTAAAVPDGPRVKP